ncbi:hypothetical protein [Pseudobacteriovorax antillogorgiicola]|uniref:Uncharacterized protein n=1 Tax=Pseudobacteriovorax antillogorgiicola TaxID=1513793 RepID=A0A1Y6BS76_9BACT|nr:hypothetical protein [Pseudobacteriovorax antillogorgiicola]TCS53142.1 hypothetical protein EDD56_108193 [Pseudobacteriovorax antillogorgiicola]SMF25263.1 hypothetical protein SAMN06296036_10853 [Pseudobacteriovorax antillogorgiicola]
MRQLLILFAFFMTSNQVIALECQKVGKNYICDPNLNANAIKCTDLEVAACSSSFEAHGLQCRVADDSTGEYCTDIFLVEAGECSLIKTRERCEDARSLYRVDCQWRAGVCEG